MPWTDWTRALLGAAALCSTACWNGADADGKPCTKDAHCGRNVKCEQGFCGGASDTTGTPTTDTMGVTSDTTTTTESTGTTGDPCAENPSAPECLCGGEEFQLQFLPPTNVVIPTGAFNLVAADFDKDLLPDLAVANFGTFSQANDGSIWVLLGLGDGTFQEPTELQNDPGTIRDLAVGDMDGDGNVDIVGAWSHAPNTPGMEESGFLDIYYGTGEGFFDELETIFTYAPFEHITAVRIADMDMDLDQDLVVLASTPGPDFVDILDNRGGAFEVSDSRTVGPEPWALALGPLPNSRAPAVFLANTDEFNSEMDDRLEVFENSGVLFGLQTPYSLGEQQPETIALGPVNSDGHLDFVVANAGVWVDTDENGTFDTPDDIPDQLTLGLGDANNQFSISHIPVGNSPRGVVLADMDCDGDQDIVVSHAGDNDVCILLNSGEANFRSGGCWETDGPSPGLVVADFNQDGRPDFANTNFDGRNIRVRMAADNGG